MPKVSILVPIYNVEKYLKECLDSLINQTLQDIEIICLNDGSTDSSPEILAEYAAKDNRIKVINKENSGYGNSMNIGLDAATGEFIGIVESDDFADKDMFKDLYEIAKESNAEVIKSDWFCYTTKTKIAIKAGKIPHTDEFKVFNIKDNVKFLRTQPSIWSSIYKREFLNTKNIRFLETPGASYQDVSFAFKTLAAANKIAITSKAYLYYRQDNENSSVKSLGKVYMICEEHEELTRFLNENPQIKDFAQTIKLIMHYKAYMWNLKRIDAQFQDEFIERFSSTFKQFFDNGEIKDDFFKKINKREFNLLIKNKNKFKQRFIRKQRKEKLNNFRRNLFSFRINKSSVRVVLLGKAIIDINR